VTSAYIHIEFATGAERAKEREANGQANTEQGEATADDGAAALEEKMDTDAGNRKRPGEPTDG
jgi:hypothetical protein